MICLKYLVLFKQFADKSTIQNHKIVMHAIYSTSNDNVNTHSGPFADNMVTGDNIG
jgi:stress-induced morphogen